MNKFLQLNSCSKKWLLIIFCGCVIKYKKFLKFKEFVFNELLKDFKKFCLKKNIIIKSLVK